MEIERGLKKKKKRRKKKTAQNAFYNHVYNPNIIIIADVALYVLLPRHNLKGPERVENGA